MKLRRWMSYVAAGVAALGLFCLGPSPATAEEELGVTTKITDWGPLRYRAFQYPSRSTGFMFYPNSYVTFDVVNGKYWMIESNRMDYEMHHISGWTHLFPFAFSPKAIRPEQIDVTFYTPDMRELAHFDKIRAFHLISIPRDGNDYERIVCRMECHGEQNWDIKMRVWDAIDPVMAEPIGGARSRP